MRHFIFPLILLLACDGNKKDKPLDKSNSNEGVNKSYAKDGKLLNEIAMKDGKRNGLSKSYYSNGKVSLEIPYKNDKREGTARRYYENGKLFQETNYIDDAISGTQKKYWENGNLLSTCAFFEGNPCVGLKEFNEDGSERTSNEFIRIEPVDNLHHGYYLLKISYSKKSSQVTFFEGKSTQDGCFNSHHISIGSDAGEGIAILKIPVPQGKFLVKDFNILAIAKTNAGNSRVIQKKYHLEADNR